MYKLILTFLLLTTSLVLSTKKCDTNGHITCDDNHECRKIDSEWYCIQKPSNNHNAMKFLGQFKAAEDIGSIELFNFIYGFNEGFALYYNLPHFKSCITPTEDMVNDLDQMFKGLIWFVYQQDPFVLLDVIKNFGDFIRRLQDKDAECKALYVEAYDVTGNIIDFINDEDYDTKFKEHFMDNQPYLAKGASEIKTSLENGDYSMAGVYSGNLVKFLLLWDLEKL